MYCQTYDTCVDLFMNFKTSQGGEFTEPPLVKQVCNIIWNESGLSWCWADNTHGCYLMIQEHISREQVEQEEMGKLHLLYY